MNNSCKAIVTLAVVVDNFPADSAMAFLLTARLWQAYKTQYDHNFRPWALESMGCVLLFLLLILFHWITGTQFWDVFWNDTVCIIGSDFRDELEQDQNQP